MRCRRVLIRKKLRIPKRRLNNWAVVWAVLLGRSWAEGQNKKRPLVEPFLDESLFFFVLSTFFVQVPIGRLLLTLKPVKLLLLSISSISVLAGERCRDRCRGV